MAPADDKQAAPAKDGAELGFDEHLARLESIVHELEEGGLGLESAIERYQEGIEHLKQCHGTLERYKHKVEELTRDAEGTLRAFAGDPDAGGGA